MLPHIKHVDSVTDITASGSKVFYANGSDRQANSVSGVALLNSISPDVASAHHIASSVGASEGPGLPGIAFNSVGSLGSIGTDEPSGPK